MRGTDLETYFARSLGLALLSLAFVVVLLSGVIPLTSASEGEFPFALAPPTSSVKHDCYL